MGTNLQLTKITQDAFKEEKTAWNRLKVEGSRKQRRIPQKNMEPVRLVVKVMRKSHRVDMGLVPSGWVGLREARNKRSLLGFSWSS